MKTAYEKPELETKAYAQFESVFTACDKNPSHDGVCNPVDNTESGAPDGIPSGYCHHDLTKGSF